MIKQILLVGTGGAVGSILRFIISEAANRYYILSFPLATFAINIIGCFIIGLLISSTQMNNSLRLLLVIGFCGGFTTFSAFARETLDLINHNQLSLAFIYTIASCVVGVCAVWLGLIVNR